MTTVFKQLIFLLVVSLINVSVVALSVSAKKWLVRNIRVFREWTSSVTVKLANMININIRNVYSLFLQKHWWYLYNVPYNLSIISSQFSYCRTTKSAQVASFSSALKAATNEDVSGYYLTKTPLLNKATAFTHEEREKLGLRGLFPAGEPQSLELKLEIAMENFRGKVQFRFCLSI